jgi:taurine dioxygenase
VEDQRIAGALGAEILGVDLNKDLSAATLPKSRKASSKHQVIFFRDQTLDAGAVHGVRAAHGQAGRIPVRAEASTAFRR